MGENDSHEIGRGKWMALGAALLGWMFDGLEQGLFPLVARPALADLLATEEDAVIGRWIAIATAGFLVGAATGGVLFGWLGDRIGRVRAMSLSVLTYAMFSGFCSAAQSAEQVTALRFLSALGMGGEWSLGVALVMEVWPDRSRGLLAGLIGAAANVGFLLIAVLGLGLQEILPGMETKLLWLGLPASWAAALAAHSGWRLLMLAGAAPALLTFFIRLFVPESKRWQHERERGTTSHWATQDLVGVVVGSLAACFIIYLLAKDFAITTRIVGSALALVVILAGYLYPVLRYLQRARGALREGQVPGLQTVGRMLLGACLSGVPLLATWASLQWAPSWADQLSNKAPGARAYTQIAGAAGAIAGTITAAWLGQRFARRITYVVLCAGSLAAALMFFRLNDHFGPWFLASIFLAGCLTASFYGWLPLYLPELFRTGVRATGQGFSYNFGRILAAIGVLQTGNLMGLFKGGYPEACSLMSLIYLLGLVIIWFAPETRGRPLPE